MLRKYNQQATSASETAYVLANMIIGDNPSITGENINTIINPDLIIKTKRREHAICFKYPQRIQQLHQQLNSWAQIITLLPESYIEIPVLDRPFEVLLESDLKTRKRLMEEVKTLPLSYAERLYKRICYLNEVTEEEYPSEELISTQSLEGFIKFIKSPVHFKYPDITITPDGNIRIQWQQDKNHHLAVEFISHTEAKYVVFSPDPVHPVKTARISGKVSIDSVIIAIQPFKALEWSTE